jgi:protein SCO1
MSRGFPVLLAVVLLAGVAALSVETAGFRTVTTAGARQLAVERTPQTLPDAQLVDQDGVRFSLTAYKGRVLLVDFIYTRCPTICGARGEDFAQILQALDGARASVPVDLLSISFDRQNDDRAARRLYGERFGARMPRWRIATPVDGRELAGLLQSFGVVVIPDGMGGFVHNDAVYVVDARGRLARILEPDAPAQLAAAALEVAAR